MEIDHTIVANAYSTLEMIKKALEKRWLISADLDFRDKVKEYVSRDCTKLQQALGLSAQEENENH